MTRVTRLQPALVAGNDLSELPDKALSRQNLGAQRRLTNTGTKTTSGTDSDGDFVLCDATAGGFTRTLPAANVSGQVLAYKKIDSSANAVTVLRAGSDTINAASASVTLSLQDEVLTFTSNGAGQWWVSGGQKSLGSLDSRFQRLFNVKAYGGVGDGVTDDYAAILAAVNAANTAGGGVVYFPAGTYKNATAVVPVYSHLTYRGDGVGRTIFTPTGNFTMFYNGSATSGSPITDVTFENFEIDGSNQANGGVYVSSMKGIQVNYCKRHVYRNLYIHDCGATGLGSDYLVDSVMENVVADNNGRLNDGTGPGGAGIGVGTGVYSVETLTIKNCITRGNGRCGVFVANQSGLVSKGTKIIGHYSSGNAEHGIADAGVGNLEVIGGETLSNGGAGFAAYKGTYSGETGPGVGGYVMGLDSHNNTGSGLYLDNSNNNAFGTYTFHGCRSHDNTANGFALSNGTTGAASGIKVRGCEIYNNQLNGVVIATAGGSVTDVGIDGNYIYSNGKNASGGTNRQGINIGCSVTQLRISGNRCWDSQGSKTQQYGLYLASVTLTGGEINDNDFAQNAVAANVSIGATFSSFRVGRNNAWTIATGSPEGAVTAPIGTQFFRLDGSTSTCLYVKESGTGNTGWRAANTYQSSGTATLVGGTVTVSDTSITAASQIRLRCATLGGTPGALYVSAKVASTSFTISSTSGTDTSTVAYEIVVY